MIIAFLLALVAVPAFAGLLPSGSDDSGSSGDTTDETDDGADGEENRSDDLTVAADASTQRAIASLSSGRDLRAAQADADAEQAAAEAAAAAATSTTTSTVPPTTAAPTTSTPPPTAAPTTVPPVTAPPTTQPPPPPPPPPTAPAPVVTGGPWDALAACESGGNWSINTGNGYYGGLQFMHATWLGYGGADFAHFPHQASREQQIAVAERLVAAAGGSYRAWPSCSAKLGLP